MSNVLIGITTYGPDPRAQWLIETIKKTTKEETVPFQIAIADDSRGGGHDNSDRRMYCRREKSVKITLLEGDTISGIPASWNRLVAFGKEQGCDIIVIVSDGVRFMIEGWLKRMVWFLENNEKVAMVGTPTVGDILDYNPNDPRWDGTPGRVGCSVGCTFSTKINVHGLIRNEDGSVGFAEMYGAFHEELSYGFSLADIGYLSYMLPYPPSWYRGGLAFARHPELVWRKPGPYLSLEKFLKYQRMSPLHIKEYEPIYEQGQVDKMAYSRLLFAQRYGVLKEIDEGRRFQMIKGEMVDCLAEPQKPVHFWLVDKWSPRKVKYLDRQGNVKEAETS